MKGIHISAISYTFLSYWLVCRNISEHSFKFFYIYLKSALEEFVGPSASTFSPFVSVKAKINPQPFIFLN